ncbi:hypothetical protein Tco_1559631, partial [Tanacetum coccineum]
MAIQEPVIEAIRPLLVVEGKGKAIDETSANIVRDSPSSADAETGAGSDETNSGGDIEARSDPGETHESRPPPEQVLIDEDQAGPNPGISHVALAGLDPEPTHDKFMADLTGTLLSIKNLEDAYAIGDQFINGKSTDDEPGKLNVKAEVVSMVTVVIYQAFSSVPLLLTLVIDLSLSKPASSTTKAPIFTATTSNTTTHPLPPPPQQQSTTDSELAARVITLEQKFATFEQK